MEERNNNLKSHRSKTCLNVNRDIKYDCFTQKAVCRNVVS